MATERTRQLMLAALVVILVAVIAKLMWPDTSAAPAATSNRAAAAATAGAPARRTQAAPTAPAPPGVHLDALHAERPKPEGPERNLFRFKPKAPPPPPPYAVRTAPPPISTAPPVSAGPPPPPPLAPIALKFIGVMGPDTAKIAILSDGRNPPFLGKEGAIIEGRYRIIKIGVESVELAYADGRGRQTIRLTGS
jgi:hypothetical protein